MQTSQLETVNLFKINKPTNQPQPRGFNKRKRILMHDGKMHTDVIVKKIRQFVAYVLKTILF